MIELKQLRQLVTVAERGTVTAASRELFLSQPALSRSIQRLEADLGVGLFDHGKNNTRLNQVGELAVERARVILGEVDALSEQLRALEQSLRTIFVGACAPMPCALLVSSLTKCFVDRSISTELTSQEQLLSGLQNDRYQIIILDRELELEGCLSRRYLTEQIYLSVPWNHPLAERSAVSLSDLAGMTILGYQNVGRWELLYQYLPQVHFIIEKDVFVIRELIRSAPLPTLASSLDPFLQELRQARAVIPFTEAETHAAYYLYVREAQATLLESLV